jgi:flavin reductase (DIM6/NTAB) family NADH-FMN oxidoreductase RutF
MTHVAIRSIGVAGDSLKPKQIRSDRKTAPGDGNGFSPRQFRDALGMFPTGVTVVTARSPRGHQLGLTVNSFTSVSLDPPLVLFNLSTSLASLSELLQADTFAVNVLTDGQRELSARFACAQSDKWASASSRPGRATSCPVLVPHLAVFEGARYAAHEAGDHMIVIGRVLHFECNESASPLLFFRGCYRGVGHLIEK